jgi:hypothetical protein
MRAIRYSIFLSLEDPESYPLLHERALVSEGYGQAVRITSKGDKRVG